MNKHALLAVGIRIVGIFTGLDLILGVVRLIGMGVYSSLSNISGFFSVYPQIQFQDYARLLVLAISTFIFLKYPDRVAHLLVRNQKESLKNAYQKTEIVEIVLIVLGLSSLLSGIRFAIMSISIYLLDANVLSYPVIITAVIYSAFAITLLTKCTFLAKVINDKVIDRFVK